MALQHVVDPAMQAFGRADFLVPNRCRVIGQRARRSGLRHKTPGRLEIICHLLSQEIRRIGAIRRSR